MRILAILVAGLSCFLVTAEKALSQGDVDKGRTVSQKHCTRCHVVGDFNRMGGIGSTPSFQIMVNAMKDYRDRFETFYARRPHGAVITIKGIERPNDLPENAAPITLASEDIDHILAFIETLKKK